MTVAYIDQFQVANRLVDSPAGSPNPLVDIQNQSTSHDFLCTLTHSLPVMVSPHVVYWATKVRHCVRSADDPGAVPRHGQGLGVRGAAHRARRWEDELEALCMDTQAPCREVMAGDGMRWYWYFQSLEMNSE